MAFVAGALVAAVPVSAATIYGTPRSDSLRGTINADRISGRGGADTLRGLAGPDRLFGGGGTDRLIAGPGADYLFGGEGSDRIEAREGGSDLVRCGAGRDTAIVDGSDLVDPDCEIVRLPPACSDGIDNDGDGWADYSLDFWLSDPGCFSSTDESEQAPGLECDDGLDNDADGLIDYPRDPDCVSPGDIESVEGTPCLCMPSPARSSVRERAVPS